MPIMRRKFLFIFTISISISLIFYLKLLIDENITSIK